MIKVEKIDGEKIIINAELIESIQATPDTVITLTSNKKIIVKNDVEDIIDKVVTYRKETFPLSKFKE